MTLDRVEARRWRGKHAWKHSLLCRNLTNARIVCACSGLVLIGNSAPAVGHQRLKRVRISESPMRGLPYNESAAAVGSRIGYSIYCHGIYSDVRAALLGSVCKARDVESCCQAKRIVSNIQICWPAQKLRVDRSRMSKYFQYPYMSQ